jgi:MFS family permease
MPGKILIDVSPLRGSRDFRLLFAGQLAAVFGAQLASVAIPFQVYALTRSSLQVGAVSLVQLAPLILGALLGGALGDAADRRLVLAVTSAVLALASGVLCLNAALGHPSLAALYLASAAAALAGGMLSTAGNAAAGALVPARHLAAAYAVMQVVDQLAMVLAPAGSGLAIEAIGLPGVFALGAGCYLGAALTALRMSPRPAAGTTTRPGLASLAEGLRYLRGRQALQGAYLIDLGATVFGLPRALFPALAASVFHGGPAVLGYLYAAPAAGALLGALTTGWLGRLRRPGLVVTAAVCAWGTAIAAFGLVRVLWLALALLAAAGWADVISAVLRSAILQRSVPDALRSRISSVQIAVVEGGPRLGDLEAGGVASLVSPEFSVVFGGLACIACAGLVAGLRPGLRRYRAVGGTD